MVSTLCCGKVIELIITTNFGLRSKRPIKRACSSNVCSKSAYGLTASNCVVVPPSPHNFHTHQSRAYGIMVGGEWGPFSQASSRDRLSTLYNFIVSTQFIFNLFITLPEFIDKSFVYNLFIAFHQKCWQLIFSFKSLAAQRSISHLVSEMNRL